MLLHVPATIGHTFTPPLSRRIIPQRDQPLPKESMHAAEMRDFGRSLFEEIDLKLALEQRTLVLVCRRGVVKTEDFGDREAVGQRDDGIMHGRTSPGGGEGLSAEMDEVGHLGVIRLGCELTKDSVIGRVVLRNQAQGLTQGLLGIDSADGADGKPARLVPFTEKTQRETGGISGSDAAYDPGAQPKPDHIATKRDLVARGHIWCFLELRRTRRTRPERR